MIDIWVEVHYEFVTFETTVSAQTTLHGVRTDDGTDVTFSANPATGNIPITADWSHWKNTLEDVVTAQATIDGFNIVRMILYSGEFVK